MSGWIKIHRQIYTHWIFQDAERLRAWLIILGHVNFKEEKVALGNDLLVCKRGESLMSLDSWAKLFGKNWNKSKVRRFLNLLKNDSMIELKNEQITTRLTVCNYDNYQDEGNASETQTKRKRNASETQVTPTKEGKESKEPKKVKNIDDRKLEFAQTLKPFLDQYGKDMINKFYSYWTEPNKSNSKFKQEMLKTWSLSHRLANWNSNNFNSKPVAKRTGKDVFLDTYHNS
jgi:hypothetical protein